MRDVNIRGNAQSKKGTQYSLLFKGQCHSLCRLTNAYINSLRTQSVVCLKAKFRFFLCRISSPLPLPVTKARIQAFYTCHPSRYECIVHIFTSENELQYIITRLSFQIWSGFHYSIIHNIMI